jgi:hypothetical protein
MNKTLVEMKHTSRDGYWEKEQKGTVLAFLMDSADRVQLVVLLDNNKLIQCLLTEVLCYSN